MAVVVVEWEGAVLGGEFGALRRGSSQITLGRTCLNMHTRRTGGLIFTIEKSYDVFSRKVVPYGEDLLS